MATSAGYNASIVWAGGNANAPLNGYNWTLTYDAGEGETTDFTSAGPKTWIALTTEWSGSFVVRLDVTTAQPAVGNAITELKLILTGAAFGYKGNAFIKTLSPTVEVNGVPEATISFRGTGALTVGAI